MANNNENISSQDTALSQMGKTDVELIVSPPNNDASHPRDGLTTSPSSKDARDTRIFHHKTINGKNYQDPTPEDTPLVMAPPKADPTVGAIFTALNQKNALIS